MLFCLTANYTADALKAMRETPGVGNRQEAVANLLEAAGGKLVSMHFTVENGPGAMAIFDVADPMMAPAITGAVAESGTLNNVHLKRLFTQEEVVKIRELRSAIRSSYRPAGR
jgi:uncharacterized protein with GYD domain